MGLLEQAKAIADPEWLIFVPSIIPFAVYDAYVNTTEYNRLFSKEQAKFFKRKYQKPDFKIPTKVGSEMYVMASFDGSLRIEIAISELKQKGIAEDNICVVPMKCTAKR